MNRFPALIAFIFIFSSCADYSKNEMAVYKASEEGFIMSNQNISGNNELIYRSAENKLMDPATRESAMIWQPKIIAIQKLSSDLVQYIAGLENELTNGKAREDEEYKKIVNNNSNDELVRALFDSKGNGEKLYAKLKKYKREVLAVDSQINATFEKSAGAISRDFEFDENRSKEFTDTYFRNIPVMGALVMLRKFENNVRIMENKFIVFCHNKMYSTGGCGFNSKVSPVVTQDSYSVKGGEPIEITAGLAIYNRCANPRFSINGKKIEADYSGMLVYKLKTSLEIGEHVVLIKMDYVSPDGTTATFLKHLKYTILE